MKQQLIIFKIKNGGKIMSELKDLKPTKLWKIFEDMCQIPRPSKNEDRIQEFTVKFGEKLGLETFKDDIKNVIIKKPATKGMENMKTVVLQAHLDMVPQKNSSSQHDFNKDPIKAYVDGDWVTAKDTTLGADNGIGAAAAMAILQSDDISHGPLEVLLTTDEETGMTGANGIKSGYLDADILINLDSEDEGELYIGCAGGVDTNGKLFFDKVEVPPNHAAYKIIVSGLKGGHSGLDINYGRGNANKIINKLLKYSAKNFGLRVSVIDGGDLRNAIPREANAIVVVPEANKDEFKKYVAEYETQTKSEFKDTDAGLLIDVNSTKTPAFLIDEKVQNNAFELVEKFPNGPIAMDKNMPDVVETSTNMAVVKSNDQFIEVCSLQRSASDADKEKLSNKIYKLITDFGGEAEQTGDYPGWKPNIDSPILNTMKTVYKENFGKTPDVKVIHAGLECGILGAVYTNWDMISFGPTIRSPHSPDEKVNIETVQKFWDFLLLTLKSIPKK